jgi:hypothetical protein
MSMNIRKHHGMIACCSVISIVFGVIWWIYSRQHAEYERRYQALTAAIPLHSTRKSVEQLLKGQSLDYAREWGPGSVAMDDLVRLGSPGRYLHSLVCDRQSPSVLIRFAGSPSDKSRRALPGDRVLQNPVYPGSDLPDDQVIGISYELICNDDL